MRAVVAVTAMAMATATRGVGVFATRGAPRENSAAFGASAEILFWATFFLWRRRWEQGCRAEGMLLSPMSVCVSQGSRVGRKGEGQISHINFVQVSTSASIASGTITRARHVHSATQSFARRSLQCACNHRFKRARTLPYFVPNAKNRYLHVLNVAVVVKPLPSTANDPQHCCHRKILSDCESHRRYRRSFHPHHLGVAAAVDPSPTAAVLRSWQPYL